MQQFENIWDRKNKPQLALNIEEIYEYDLDSTPEELFIVVSGHGLIQERNINTG